MSARHRLSAAPKSTFPGVGAAAFSASLLVVALFAALLSSPLFISTDSAEEGPAAPSAVPPAGGQLSQEGTLVAVSAGSLTARSSDGYVQTYVVTPDTLAITKGGSAPIGNTSGFSVNDEVAIIGTIRNGTPMVTAVAHRDLAHGDARPMDFLAVAEN
ncbi:hypothetical protein [Mycobacterium asiaticum]|uniref:DUF5666 domain-containing protein n=1 Tax=Mycobacterium asiaticum TaxID=1790 RepID=A0A1A3KAQ5_MYCAS|nr:hypothetical protein [Mycobacterium asiaticum]OBJ82120.1 hypothetical protein A5640_22725 [Mycobacterium asiaticum]ORA11624.1 hypothetical protein BST16_19225 [Mycobacterium asiaticum DSM 44297]